jgi:hypothetical protein
LRFLVADQPDPDLDEVAHDLLDVAPDIATSVNFVASTLRKARPQPGEAARDLRLPASGRPDHQDVLGRRPPP